MNVTHPLQALSDAISVQLCSNWQDFIWHRAFIVHFIWASWAFCHHKPHTHSYSK